MKGLKELPKNRKEPESESDKEEAPEDSRPQQSASQSQARSSDYVSLSNEYVHDSNVGYGVGNYKMEKINLRRWNLQKRCFEYLIKWKGYSNRQCTWQTTEDILREPFLPLKDLVKNTMLPLFERTHGKTIIWDDDNQKVVKEFIHNQKNLQYYGSKELIEEMKQELEDLYGDKNSEQFSEKNRSESNVKIQLDGILSETISSQNSIPEIEKELPDGFKVGGVIIEKLMYVPQEFELKIFVSSAHNPEIKKVLTCAEMMKINPETALMCYKVKLASIKKWKRAHLPFK